LWAKAYRLFNIITVGVEGGHISRWILSAKNSLGFI
jgi:hypothetical protein